MTAYERTPQNTPANNAPISSHAQQPGIASIKEGVSHGIIPSLLPEESGMLIARSEDLDRAAAASIFAQNPKLVSMIQGKLGSLVGRSSGYVESLPGPVRRRVAGLKGVQKEHAKLEGEFQEEVLQLEKKYFAKYTPIYEKRAKIVNGTAEPNEAEIKAGEQDDAVAEGEAGKAEPAEDSKDVDGLAGIPEFWLSAMKNQVSLADLITNTDEAALKFLTDIRMEYLDQPGFRLIFEFADNEFFSNKSIKKTYFYQEESGYGGEFIYDHAEGDKIDWKTGKDLTVRIESKKQRNKSRSIPMAIVSGQANSRSDTKQTRVVKKTVPTESFFNFFDPPKAPDADDEEADPDVEERLELDYQLGEDIKEKLIPRAIDWFTGEALQFEEVEDDIDAGDFEDEDDEEDEDGSEDKDDEEESEEEVCYQPTVGFCTS